MFSNLNYLKDDLNIFVTCLVVPFFTACSVKLPYLDDVMGAVLNLREWVI